jgi:hypothetical protein
MVERDTLVSQECPGSDRLTKLAKRVARRRPPHDSHYRHRAERRSRSTNVPNTCVAGLVASVQVPQFGRQQAAFLCPARHPRMRVSGVLARSPITCGLHRTCWLTLVRRSGIDRTASTFHRGDRILATASSRLTLNDRLISLQLPGADRERSADGTPRCRRTPKSHR